MARFAEWPDEVCFTIAELDAVLTGLDDAADAIAPTSDAFRSVRRAQVAGWRRLWPELADHYDEGESDTEE